MDWLTFISKLVEALAWPAVVVGVLLHLRKEFPSIVRSLRKLKFKDVELEFRRGCHCLGCRDQARSSVINPLTGGKHYVQLYPHLSLVP